MAYAGGRVLLLSVALLEATRAQATDSVPEMMSFEEYKDAFSKMYADQADEENHRKAFEENVQVIAELNAKNDAGEHSFRCGVNFYTDLSRDEFRSRYLASGPTMAEADEWYRSLPKSNITADPPASVDWKAKGAVGPVKNQGACGGCWAFSTTGAVEGAYQIATGSLRSLSEQQLIDCSQSLGNMGCKGGQMRMGFDYIKMNKGIDSEDDYPFTGANGQCWTAAAKRVVATIDSFTAVTAGSEAALVAAAALGPVSVAIEADQPAFQHYKSGVFDAPCGTKLDHGVLVVGYDADSYTVKNRHEYPPDFSTACPLLRELTCGAVDVGCAVLAIPTGTCSVCGTISFASNYSWGPTWGQSGFIKMKRNVNKTGICGISQQASYPTVAKGSPLPIPPKTDPHTKPALPCNCTASCTHTCGAFGMTCCGNGIDCDCSSLSACPKCGPPPPPPYAACSAGCGAGAAAGKQECLSTQGVPGHICSPGCNAGKKSPAVQDCPALPTTAGVTAKPWCDYCMTGFMTRLQSGGVDGSVTKGVNSSAAEIPTQCALICTATSTKTGPYKNDGCPAGATCKPFSLDPDPCETTHVDLPCSKTKTCGMCTFP